MSVYTIAANLADPVAQTEVANLAVSGGLSRAEVNEEVHRRAQSKGCWEE